MRRVAGLLAAAALVLLCLTGCHGAQTGETQQGAAESGKPDVIATIFPYYDFARQIGGDRIDLTLLLPAGRDSHSFEPTPVDMIRIGECDLFLYNGGEMEQWVDQALEAVENPGRLTVRMMDYVTPVEEVLTESMELNHAHEDHDHGDGEIEEIEYDEHIWTSPKNAVVLARAVADGLIAADPENQDYYEANLETLTGQLEELDSQFRQAVAEGSRNVVIFGDKFPFRYLADEYGLEYYAAFPGCASDTEPSAATIAFLINKVRDEQVPAVLKMELSSDNIASAIAEATGTEVRTFYSCHNLSAEDFENGENYLSMMEKNAETLKEVLNDGSDQM